MFIHVCTCDKNARSRVHYSLIQSRINLLVLSIFPPSFHSIVVFLSCRSFIVNATFSTGLVGKDVQMESNTTIEWDDGGKIGNKNKLILTEIFPYVPEMIFKSSNRS
jgi:hypothetical protein